MGKETKEQEINIHELIANARKQINDEPNMSAGLKATLELVLGVCLLLAGKHAVKNSKNSNLPPAMDPNREKTSQAKNKRKPGGQPGHEGNTLQPVDNPDEIKELKIDRETLPPGKWKSAGYERRQVFNLVIKRQVTEYRAERLENEHGEYVTAEFPGGLVQAAQYGNSVKAHGVYMSVEQLVPCERVSEHFDSQLNLPVSAGSICNFKKEAYERLETFEEWLKTRLIASGVLHCDETGININSSREWIHSVSTGLYTYYYPHTKRGKEAMDEMGVLPLTEAVLIHDHWKAYYSYEGKTHGLCNAHHIRELTGAEEEGQRWARPMTDFLLDLNKEVEGSGGELTETEQEERRKRYRKIIKEAEKECPPPPPNPPGKRGRVPKSKARNLIERLRDYENDALRFMANKEIPFTNNQAERDLRMIKVHQKISGCFRSWDGAYYFCRIKSYLSTCEKHDISSANALKMLFEGQMPGFMFENVLCG
jgi:transposase